MGPTLAGFLAFIRGQMGIGTVVLPDASPAIPAAYALALEIVNLSIQQASPLVYNLAVYNLGGDNIVNFAQDQAGQTFFADLRKAWGITSFVAGVVASSADESTSESLLVSDAMRGLQFGDLQYLKTPYGRQYLAFAQRYGTLWGVS